MSRTYLGIHDFTDAVVLGVPTNTATVGAGGEFPDIQAAITGVGGDEINLILVSSIVEDSDIAVPVGINLSIDLRDFTLIMSAFQFTYTGEANVFIKGNGVASGAQIDYANTTGAGNFFDNSAHPGSIVDAQDFIFNNDSTTVSDNFFSGAIQRITDMKAALPDLPNKGFELTVDGSFLDNVEIEGGGTSCDSCVVLGSVSNDNIRGTNLLFTAQFDPSTPALQILGGASVDGIIAAHTVNGAQIEIGAGSVNNIRNTVAFPLDLVVTGDDVSITNVDLGDGDLEIAATDQASVIGLETTGTMTNVVASENVTLTDCRFETAVTFNGDRYKIANCELIGGATVASGSDNNLFANCQFGADAGGGALTLTFAAGSNGNNAVGCIADAAMVDSGTGNAQDFIVY